MTWVIVIVVTLVLVIGLGVLIFKLMRRTKDVVPDVVDRPAAHRDRVVGVDNGGAPVMESQEGDASEPHDDAGFENVLKDQLDDIRS
jgi:hypothetical protein